MQLRATFHSITTQQLRATLRARHFTTCMAAGSHQKELKILGISGSLRKASCNTGLLRAAAKYLPDLGAQLEIADISDMPLYNEDIVTEKGEPDSVLRLREQLQRADGILFASPEYNYNVTAAMKNALDWPSKNPNAYENKPAAVIGAGGGGGASLSNHALRQSGVFLNLRFTQKPGVGVKIFDKPSPFEASGDLKADSSWQPQIKKAMEELVKWIRQLQKE